MTSEDIKHQLIIIIDSDQWGAGIAQWSERRTRDWKVAGSNPCWNGGRIFFSRVDFLCWPLFRYPFHPRVTAVARKKSRSFCQKCRWQVTAKTRIHPKYVAFIEPCFGIGHNLSLICQMTSEDIKHQLIIIIDSDQHRPYSFKSGLFADSRWPVGYGLKKRGKCVNNAL